MTDETVVPAAKPPLSDPMAEALAEDAAAARAAEAQAAEAPPEETPEPAEPAVAEAEAAPAEDEPAKPPKKTGKDALVGRVGYLTAKVTEETTRAETLARENQALKDLLAAQGKAPAVDGEGGASPPQPSPLIPPAAGTERTYTQAEVQAEARRIADAAAFDARANQVYDAGKEKFGDWDESMNELRLMGVMSVPLVDAVIETGAPTDVFHALGADLDEAARIASLPPIKMGIALGELARKATTPKQVAISGAPAPITPINGGVSPLPPDLRKLAESDDMAAYVAARKASGDRWAK